MRLLILAIAVWLGGCANMLTFKHPEPPGPVSTFTLIDERPAHEKEAKRDTPGLLWMTEEGANNVRVGDEQTIPHRFVITAGRLDVLLGERLAGREIRVLHYDIILDVSDSVRQTGMAGMFGVIGVLFLGAVDGDAQAAVVVKLELNVDGISYPVRIDHPFIYPRLGSVDTYTTAAEKAMMDAIEEANLAIASDIENGTPRTLDLNVVTAESAALDSDRVKPEPEPAGSGVEQSSGGLPSTDAPSTQPTAGVSGVDALPASAPPPYEAAELPEPAENSDEEPTSGGNVWSPVDFEM